MQISTKDWKAYINKLSAIDKRAGSAMSAWIRQNGFGDTKALVDYAYALATKYGEGSAALAAEMYDAIATMQHAAVDAAEVAATATYGETARAVQGAMKRSLLPDYVGSAVERLVKQAGADTMIQNAKRDGAYWAWIPSGDTCAFCITLASNGWQPASKAQMKGNHATHIHAHCDCQFCIRFGNKLNVKGYNPEVYRRMYYDADTSSAGDRKAGKIMRKGAHGRMYETTHNAQSLSTARINGMRRAMYAENKDIINAQKRSAYAFKTGHKKTQFIDPMIVNMMDENVIKTVSAKGRNYDIMDLVTGDMYHLADGSKLQNKEVFAGKGHFKEYRNAYKYAEKYGGKAEDWQHVKGIADLDTQDGIFRAEVHWSQCEGIGKKDFFVKRWLDDEG